MPFNKETAAMAGKLSKRGKDKTLQDLRGNFHKILSKNSKNIQIWLDQVSKDDPAKALDLLFKMSSFILPKVKAVEVEFSKSNDLNNLTDEEIDKRLENASRVINLTPISFVKTSVDN